MRNWLINLSICSISVVVMLIFFEFISTKYLEKRLLVDGLRDWRSDMVAFTDDCYNLSDSLGFVPIWGMCGYPKLTTDTSTNIMGVSSEKIFKILILGDSNTNRGNFDKLLESSLNDISRDKNIKFDVVKVGIESYNTKQEVELLKTELLKLRPNFIVLQYTPNDFQISPVAVKINNQIVYFSSNGTSNIENNSFLFRNSSLYRIYKLSKLVSFKGSSNTGDRLTNETSYQWETERKEMAKTLDIYRDILVSNNIRSVALVYPIFNGLQWTRESDEMIRLLSERSVDQIDLLEMSKSNGGISTYQQKTESGVIDVFHPNGKFDVLVADALLNYLLSNRILPIN